MALPMQIAVDFRYKVGDVLKVYWENEDEWYEGEVIATRVREDKAEYLVLYIDNEVCWENQTKKIKKLKKGSGRREDVPMYLDGGGRRKKAVGLEECSEEKLKEMKLKLEKEFRELDSNIMQLEKKINYYRKKKCNTKTLLQSLLVELGNKSENNNNKKDNNNNNNITNNNNTNTNNNDNNNNNNHNDDDDVIIINDNHNIPPFPFPRAQKKVLVSTRKRLSDVERDEGINHLFHSIMMAVMACNTGDIIYVEEGVWGGERGLEIENQDGAIDIRKSLKIEGRGDKEKIILRTPDHYIDECFLSISSSSSLSLTNLTLGPAGEYCGIVKATEKSVLYLNNCHFSLSQSSVQVGVGCSAAIHQCCFEGSSIEGLSIHALAKEVFVADSTFRCCSGGDEFIRLGATSAVAVVTDLTLQEVHTAPSNGVATAKITLLRNKFLSNFGHWFAHPPSSSIPSSSPLSPSFDFEGLGVVVEGNKAEENKVCNKEGGCVPGEGVCVNREIEFVDESLMEGIEGLGGGTTLFAKFK